MPLSEQLTEYIAACFTGIWIESHEHEDALAEIGRLCHDSSGHWPPGTSARRAMRPARPRRAIQIR